MRRASCSPVRDSQTWSCARKGGILRFGVLILALAGLIGGAFWYYHHQRYKHFAVHDEGLVYRSAWLEPDVFAELIETKQIRTVINLCEPGEMGEERWEGQRKAVRGAGGQLIELSFPRVVSIDDPAVDKFIEIYSNPDNYPILLHCQHGVTRTAKALSIYDILFQGMTAEESLGRMPLFGRDQHNVAIVAFARDFEDRFASKTAEFQKDLEILRK